MLDESQKLNKSVASNHHNVYVLTEKLRALIGEVHAKGDIQELSDIAYALNECTKMLEDSRKSINQVKTQLDALICAEWVKSGVAERITTPYCYVHPNVKMVVQVPHRATKPERFEAFMKAFNIPESLWKFRNEAGEIDLERTEVVRMHYPGVVEYISKLLEDGKPLPPEIEQGTEKYPVYSLKILGRKGVGE
jgi:hypothetical protein